MDKTQQNLTISRRNLLKFGAGVAGTAALTAGLGTKVSLFKSQPAVAQNNITPEEALKQLLEGNQRFIENKRKSPNQTLTRVQEVAQGQAPFAAILSCADSRVPSEIIFDRGFGDLFVVRNAGNIATPEEIGSLEFGTLVLGAKVLMVIGHQSCGAVKATIAGNAVPGQIASILDAIKPAIKPNQTLEESTIANVKLGISRLQASPVISQLIKDGKLKIAGGYYNLETGMIKVVA
ncbi:carbonic anhydrase [Planktothrix agardhii]|jgi:carbonic anhydrase|uniref:carbonic anhydrase n=1 Tax=Planktothrix agardhii TaxID=1160 RepID=A0AAD1PZS5_PLAAG|nr:carbonic anhydrase [Planktothrix agardhii]MCB8785533.1 carbonic anhydrase [Planktothrix agardhii 1025]MCF3612747.1 carbonic anhydrase [Planktothrix agardhii 1027]MCF3646626.1 carbonic anhydrase [Planktothrix agardhii 1026]CAD5939128.1 Carbonic anhydrase 2 [Planktothrix agardhii]CAD5943698.1 Carbonic anhydrase 2 [Planktothrix agardhii]